MAAEDVDNVFAQEHLQLSIDSRTDLITLAEVVFIGSGIVSNDTSKLDTEREFQRVHDHSRVMGPQRRRILKGGWRSFTCEGVCMEVMLQTKAALDRKNSETKALMLVSKKEERIWETL